MSKIRIRNRVDVVTATGVPISVLLRWRLMTYSLEECRNLLKTSAIGGWIFTGGSHHIAVIRNGRCVLQVKEINV